MRFQPPNRRTVEATGDRAPRHDKDKEPIWPPNYQTSTSPYIKMVPTRCNNQLAAANYIRAPGVTDFERLSIDVLPVEDGQIAEIMTFPDTVFDAFGLPERL